jgi:hypothetical protein
MTRSGINMTFRRSMCGAVVVSACSLSAGCQNKLSVRVERVLGADSTRLDPDSRLGRQLDAAVADLGGIRESCRRADGRWREFLEACPEEVRPGVAATLSTVTDTFAGIGNEADDLRRECLGYFELGDVTPSTSDLRTTLRKVRYFLVSADDRINSAVHAMMQTDSFGALGEEVKGIAATAAAEALAVIDEADKPSPGFGGFVSTDIYTINPSDPEYRKILNSSSPWAPFTWALFKRNLSVELLTQADVEVTGDSSIMLVMEHPGQYRVYQISNDPTQIARNIALVVSKATAAMARFAAIVP